MNVTVQCVHCGKPFEAPHNLVGKRANCPRCHREFAVTEFHMAEPPDPSGVVVHRIEAMVDGFRIERDADGAYRVLGKRIERVANQTNFDVEESSERFQRDLRRLGVDAELRRAGVQAGDTVRIGGAELEWEYDAWEDR